MSKHRRLLWHLADQYHFRQPPAIRYNYNVMIKPRNYSDTAHSIDCHVSFTPEGFTTLVNVGPYISVQEVDEDIRFLNAQINSKRKD